MPTELNFKITLTKPTSGVDFCLQKGSGNDYETVQKQRANSQELSFTFSATVKGDKQKDAFPKLSGPFVQGPTGEKFVYIDVGTCAGQTDSLWTRRMKIPLKEITWDAVDKFIANPKLVLETIVAGTGKDGGPNCATIKPFNEWSFKKASDT